MFASSGAHVARALALQEIRGALFTSLTPDVPVTAALTWGTGPGRSAMVATAFWGDRGEVRGGFKGALKTRQRLRRVITQRFSCCLELRENGLHGRPEAGTVIHFAQVR